MFSRRAASKSCVHSENREFIDHNLECCLANTPPLRATTTTTPASSPCLRRLLYHMYPPSPPTYTLCSRRARAFRAQRTGQCEESLSCPAPFSHTHTHCPSTPSPLSFKPSPLPPPLICTLYSRPRSPIAPLTRGHCSPFTLTAAPRPVVLLHVHPPTPAHMSPIYLASTRAHLQLAYLNSTHY